MKVRSWQLVIPSGDARPCHRLKKERTERSTLVKCQWLPVFCESSTYRLESLLRRLAKCESKQLIQGRQDMECEGAQ